MAVRTTIDLPEPLHERLRERAARAGRSMRSLIIQAVEEAYGAPGKKHRLTGPFLPPGQRGPLYPKDENPHDLILP